MTEQTFELRKVSGIEMAVGAVRPLAAMFAAVDWEERSIVVECSSEPRSGLMTAGAIRREPSGGVLWLAGGVVFRSVTSEAVLWCSSVDACRMTLGAIDGHVRPREREGGGCMVEYCAQPLVGIMTSTTIG